MAEKIPGWLERVLLPQISELKGEIKVVNARIDSLDEKFSGRMDGLDEKFTGRMDWLGEKIDGVERRLEYRIDEVDKRLGGKIDDLDKRLDMTQRLTVVETQLKELSAKA